MPEAVIVSTARTPIAKAFRGSLQSVQGPTLAASAALGALKKSGLEGEEIEELVLGCALTQGTSGINVARHTVFAADLPDSVAGITVDRQCASGLSAISIAAQQIQSGQSEILLAGGMDSTSLVQNKHWNAESYRVPNVRDGYYVSMVETAERVASKYGISRIAQDEYALLSQQRTASARSNDRFADEIVPVELSHAARSDEAIGDIVSWFREDECNRPATSLEGLASLKPVLGEDATVTPGNSSQLSDGAAACVLMSAKAAHERGIPPLGIVRGMVTVGCAPEEMGIGPALAIPRLLERFNLQVRDIDLWEINEAFASQVVYCAATLNIPFEKLNVNGGAISLGHPYGMSGARLAGHALLEGRRRDSRLVVVSLCVGWGMGAAALLEVAHEHAPSTLC